MSARRGPRPASGGDAGRGAVAADVGGDARGTVRIAPAVLFELIELAVRAVPGVGGLASPRGVDRILPRGVRAAAAGVPDQADPAAGARAYESAGIRVRLEGDRLDADVGIVIAPGAGVLDLSRAIQQKVGAAAGRMLGLTVTGVNVYVADVTAASGGKGSGSA